MCIVSITYYYFILYMYFNSHLMQKQLKLFKIFFLRYLIFGVFKSNSGKIVIRILDCEN